MMDRRWALMTHHDLRQLSPPEMCSSAANMDIFCFTRPSPGVGIVPEYTKTLCDNDQCSKRVNFPPSPINFTDKTVPQERLITNLGSRAETTVIPSILCSFWSQLYTLKNTSGFPV